jgi:RNA polymerase sigma factor (sigma-70 family)
MHGRMVEQPRNRRQWSDSALLSAISARDGAAFAAFYRRHLPAVLAFLLRETRDREAAADLAAEVFAAVLLSAAKYAERGESATPWVLGIARDKLLMSLRRGRVEARARHRLGFQAVALDDADLERIEAVAIGESGQLVALVEDLPEEERYAVRSRVLDERPYGEIATELRCSELVIRKRVSRGLARMREQLRNSTPPARSA